MSAWFNEDIILLAKNEPRRSEGTASVDTLPWTQRSFPVIFICAWIFTYRECCSRRTLCELEEAYRVNNLWRTLLAGHPCRKDHSSSSSPRGGIAAVSVSPTSVIYPAHCGSPVVVTALGTTSHHNVGCHTPPLDWGMYRRQSWNPS